MGLTRFGCCCRIGREGVCGLNTGSVNPMFSAAGQQLGIRQQHRFGGYLMSRKKGAPLCHQHVHFIQPS